MEGILVYLVGNGLFAESVEKMIRQCGVVKRVDRFSTIDMSIQVIDLIPPDVLILADVDMNILAGNTPFLPICPDIPVICTDHQSNVLKLITTTNINARLPDLINTLTFLKSTKVQR